MGLQLRRKDIYMSPEGLLGVYQAREWEGLSGKDNELEITWDFEETKYLMIP